MSLSLENLKKQNARLVLYSQCKIIQYRMVSELSNIIRKAFVCDSIWLRHTSDIFLQKDEEERRKKKTPP